MENIETLKYPIGRFTAPATVDENQIKNWIAELAVFPQELRKIASTLTKEELETAYRAGGWTARQVIHHLADSHINAYIRTKWVITEDNPTIKPYVDAAWANLSDGKNAEIDLSLDLLESLHQRWVFLLKTLTLEDFNRTYFHPEQQKQLILKNMIAVYAWHGQHHIAHLKLVKKGS